MNMSTAYLFAKQISAGEVPSLFIKKSALLDQLQRQIGDYGKDFGIEINNNTLLALRKQYAWRWVALEAGSDPWSYTDWVFYDSNGAGITNMTGESASYGLGCYTGYRGRLNLLNVFKFRVQLDSNTPSWMSWPSMQAVDTESSYAYYYAILTKLKFPVFDNTANGVAYANAVIAYVNNPIPENYAAVENAFALSLNP